MIALDALTERTVTIKNPINPARVKIIFMCSVPVNTSGKTLHPIYTYTHIYIQIDRGK